VFALLFGYSRIPYAAATSGDFFPVFSRLHPEGHFPHVSLLVIGGLSMAACLFSLDQVITALITSRILVQFIGQVFALHYLRKHRTDIRRPFRMWLYPLPSAIALVGWIYVFASAGTRYIVIALLVIAAGAVAYRVWVRTSARRS